MDDSIAIKRCQTGDTDAFRHLVERYQRQAIGHAISILGNREDALDAVQEAFIDAFRTLGTFDEARRFYPWFYVVLRHRCFKVAAERNASPVSPSGDLVMLAPAVDQGIEQTVFVEEALRRLTPEERELLLLRELDGLSYEELAERLSIPVGTIMSRLFYARKRFRTCLAGRGQG